MAKTTKAVAARKSAQKKAAPKKAAKQAASRKSLKRGKDGVVLLSGGNPQIAKGYGDAPVEAWIAAAPGWKGDVARKLDAIVVKTSPGVAKAVKWNSPFYGLEEGSWFLCLHCFTKFVRVTFFQGAGLDPQPAGLSTYPAVRYYDIAEGALDEKQFASWVKQARKLPGERV